MIKTLTSFFLILLVSCSPTKKVENPVYYIIPLPATFQNDLVSDAPLPIPTAFYGQHNFILYDSSRVFYHNNYVFYSCGMGIDFSKPPRLFLAPDSLEEITISELPAFLETLTPRFQKGDRRLYTNISSSTDTIRNPAFDVLAAYFKTKGVKIYGIRGWTEEEAFATKAKAEHNAYDPKTAEFKTGFDIDFIPPLDSISISE